MQPIRRLLALVAVPALAALCATPAGAASSASSATFSAPPACQSQYFTVPANVTAVVVDAWGGAGGHNEHTGAGGPGAHVRTALSVNPGERLTVDVGVWGDAHGGCGLIRGGDRGGAIHGDAAGRDGYGGGSGSAVTTADVTPLVIAGGGGGGGGKGGFGSAFGGNGGAGSAAGDIGFPGQPGANGGCGGCNGQWSGAEGDDQTWGSGGAGGGGGGGYEGGGGGDGTPSGGGGGGGGGSSYAVTANPIVTYSDRVCQYPDYSPTCDGAVTFTWDLTPASIAATAGGGQQAQVGTIFDQRLTAKVLNAEGLPVEGVAVTFALPSGGASGSWPAGDGTTASATTDANGLAVAPLLRAGGAAGSWSVTATATGAGTVAYALSTTKAPTTTRVTSSADPSLVGQPVRFTANVTAAGGVPAAAGWRGIVTFYDDHTPLGAAVAVAADGSATSTTQWPILGDHPITAVYSGDANHGPSTSAVLTQQVRKVPTAVTLASDLNPSASGETVEVTATVAGHGASLLRPSGEVQFSVARLPGDAADPVGGPVTLDGDGQASATLPALTDGAYAVTASYGGQLNFEPGSGTLVQTVGPDATATALTSSVNPSVVGQPFRLTADVARTGAGAEPTGSVTFRDGADAPLCAPVALSAVATADCAVGGEPTPGALPLSASFLDPDGQYEPSSGSITQRVAPATTATTLTVASDSSAFGAPLLLRAQVEVVAPGAGEPAGTVQFAVDGRAAGAPVAVVDGAALSAPIEGLAAGPRQLSATYADGTSPLVLEPSRAVGTLVITPAPTSIEIASSAAVAPFGTALVFTATVVAETGVPVSDGDVQFLLDGAPLGAPVDVAGGVAVTPSVTGLAPGSHTITAELNGGSEFQPSSVTVTQPVLAPPADPPIVDPPPIGQPGPPAPPAPPVPPAPPLTPGRRAAPRAARLTLATRTTRAGRGGVVALALRCSGTAGTRCAGRLMLRSGRATLGTARYSLAAGRRATVRITLLRSARRTLARRGRLTLSARAVASAGKGASSKLTVRAASAR
ncbi:Ig-like domain repeat protein [Conexibacter stalactiti]|uniref:Ig-like domain repeat protein n=1 Tax=Conexibacter stalactiti TaxID=1940611 RepID=A0ABU4HVQ8_9ACTN|nr:Ig-like domain repeat protein [Conexibacter stalactiti]MDW5596767.1 Ig-like domain repeat protein [Conexibacter stalactiti]MEC5037409.1 Ig-like domain repeat protein [Conexibacter stalactiti]